MNRIVLDSSALLAILNEEPGAEIFTRQFSLLERATMSTVSVAETFGKLVEKGINSEDAWDAVTAAVPEVMDFDTEQAKIAGRLVAQTRTLGLSLGDRACLALGIALQAPIYTADRAWKDLKLRVLIHIIR